MGTKYSPEADNFGFKWSQEFVSRNDALFLKHFLVCKNLHIFVYVEVVSKCTVENVQLRHKLLQSSAWNAIKLVTNNGNRMVAIKSSCEHQIKR